MNQQAAAPARQGHPEGQPPAKENTIETICKSLTNDVFKKQLEAALPPGISVERYARTAVNAIQMHPQKDKFNNCDKTTLFLSVQKAAADGLSLDGREATLVAFWNKTKNKNDIAYFPMVQGLVKVARNSGEIANIKAHVVYMNDEFRFIPGQDSEPFFNPDWKVAPSARGDAILAFCVIEMKDGTILAPEPIHKERIIAIGNAGKNGNQYDPTKGPHFTEWWKKTAIKNALKYAPKSSELLSVENSDNEAQEFDFEKLRDVTGQPPREDLNSFGKSAAIAGESATGVELQPSEPVGQVVSAEQEKEYVPANEGLNTQQAYEASQNQPSIKI